MGKESEHILAPQTVGAMAHSLEERNQIVPIRFKRRRRETSLGPDGIQKEIDEPLSGSIRSGRSRSGI